MWFALARVPPRPCPSLKNYILTLVKPFILQIRKSLVLSTRLLATRYDTKHPRETNCLGHLRTYTVPDGQHLTSSGYSRIGNLLRKYSVSGISVACCTHYYAMVSLAHHTTTELRLYRLQNLRYAQRIAPIYIKDAPAETSIYIMPIPLPTVFRDERRPPTPFVGG